MRTEPIPVLEAKNFEIEIVDFGVCEWTNGSCVHFLAAQHTAASIDLIGCYPAARLQPLKLCAPEVVAYAGWGTPCDIWAAGCLVSCYLMRMYLNISHCIAGIRTHRRGIAISFHQQT